MTKKNPENLAEASNPKFYSFAVWMALGTILGSQAFEGVDTQLAFGKKYGINKTTMSRWKAKDEFWQLVSKTRKQVWKERIGNAVLSLEQRALREGSAPEVKLLLQVAGELSEDTGGNLRVPEEVNKAIQKIANLLP